MATTVLGVGCGCAPASSRRAFSLLSSSTSSSSSPVYSVPISGSRVRARMALVLHSPFTSQSWSSRYFYGEVGRLALAAALATTCTDAHRLGPFAVQANIFERIVPVVKSYANALGSAAEDPEKLLDQTVNERNEDLTKMRSAQALASQKQLENKYKAATQTADDWYQRAKPAPEKGNEYLAKEALKRRKDYEVPTEKTKSAGFRAKSPQETNVVIVGATGYIGKYVVKEVVRRGYNVIAVAREKSGIGGKSGKEQTQKELPGAKLCFTEVMDADTLETSLRGTTPTVDVVISCLASRTGGVKDSWLVDYQAARNSLDAGRALGASHFVLLSAICVQKPLLEFQRAKLKFEEELISIEDGFTYSIVRPTAFFKSLGGQVESVKGGGPYVMFGDGALSACKPISEADLASFIADCIVEENKINKVLPIGGPGKALTPLEQGTMLFEVVGKEPKFIKVPIQIMDFVIGILDSLAKIFPNLEDSAEFGKIGRYYAAESMLVLDPKTGKYDADATPSYGKDTLEDFFRKVIRDGMTGQELGDQAVFK